MLIFQFTNYELSLKKIAVILFSSLCGMAVLGFITVGLPAIIGYDTVKSNGQFVHHGEALASYTIIAIIFVSILSLISISCATLGLIVACTCIPGWRVRISNGINDGRSFSSRCMQNVKSNIYAKIEVKGGTAYLLKKSNSNSKIQGVVVALNKMDLPDGKIVISKNRLRTSGKLKSHSQRIRNLMLAELR